MACSCSKTHTQTQTTRQVVTPRVCSNTREEIEELLRKIICRKDIHPSARMNGSFNILTEMLQSGEYCKVNLTPIYQLIYEFPNVC